MPVYFVYMVRCADDSLYCGITTHLARRLRQHNGEVSGGGRYTRSRRPVRLVACRTCADKGTALSLEARLKKLPRHRKLEALYRLPDKPEDAMQATGKNGIAAPGKGLSNSAAGNRGCR